MKAIKSLTQQGPCVCSTVKLGSMSLKGVAVSNLDDSLEACKTHVLMDLGRLENNLNERLEWSDTNLLRAIFVFIATYNWLRGH